MLPGYMDWYEQDTIDDLYSNMPHYVIYKEGYNPLEYTISCHFFIKNVYILE